MFPGVESELFGSVETPIEQERIHPRPLEPRIEKDGTVRPYWYGRFKINRKRLRQNLGVKVAGTRTKLIQNPFAHSLNFPAQFRTGVPAANCTEMPERT